MRPPVRHAYFDVPRVLANHHFDSRRWDSISLRRGDVVVASWAKSGTTWLQQIVLQILLGGAQDIDVADISPWVDFRGVELEAVVRKLDAQRHRRVMKTHLPADALALSPLANYLYIARDPIDVAWSWYRHHQNFTDDAYRLLNETPGLVGPPLERPDCNFKDYFQRWLDRDGFPFHPYWSNVQSWWDAREQPNIMLIHFADMLADLDGHAHQIAAFLGVAPSANAWPAILEHCTIGYMRRNAQKVVPFAGVIFRHGAASFLGTGAAGQWVNHLDVNAITNCCELAKRSLSPDCARWLLREPASLATR